MVRPKPDQPDRLLLPALSIYLNIYNMYNTVVQVIFARLNFHDFARFNPAENFAKFMFARVGQYYNHVSD